jgi:hypothetical protein
MEPGAANQKWRSIKETKTLWQQGHKIGSQFPLRLQLRAPLDHHLL